MGNRREEERERLRQARQEREKKQASSERRRLMAGYGVAGVIGLVVIVGVVFAIASSAGKNDGGEAHIDVGTGETFGIQPDKRSGSKPALAKVTDLEKAAKMAGCDLRLELRDEGKTHIPVTATGPVYGTNPPTSGNHAEIAQADGAYSETSKETTIVHSLEHGRLEIQYSPDLPEADQEELIGLYETMWGGTLIFPNENMTYEVAATTWTNLLGCNEYKGAITLDAIRAFAKET